MDSMTASPPELPDFGKPPVGEVALSVMFDSLEGFKISHVGLLWERFRERFPRTEDQAPLISPREVETESRKPLGPDIRFQATPLPQLRTWFINEAGTELLQVQHDRFARNWRCLRGDEDYLRYPSVRAPFENDLRMFGEFLAENRLGDLRPIQSEITYVNQISVDSHANLSRVFVLWTSPSMSFLPTIEDGKFSCRFVMRDNGGRFLGRLHASVQPAYRTERGNETAIFILTLTARGNPLGPDLAGALAFLDLGHEWIVRGFTDMTTAEMHKLWERRR